MLIGYFHLDPNRVLSLVLDAFEADTSNLGILELTKMFRSSSIPQILGFKFQMYHGHESGTPASLFRLAAVLICRKVLKTEELFPHLLPARKCILEQSEELSTLGVTH